MNIFVNKIERPALGCTASIGQLYDARSDNFLEASILKKNPHENCIVKKYIHSSKVKLIGSDRFTEKCEVFGVPLGLQASILAGLVSLEGSSRFLKDNDSGHVKTSLVYKIVTFEEELNIKTAKDSIINNASGNGIATHVLVGISWGATCVLSCTSKNNNERDQSETRTEIATILEDIGSSIKQEKAFTGELGWTESLYEAKIFSDLPLSIDKPFSSTLESSISILNELPSLINSRNGTGTQIKFSLVPIGFFLDYLKLPVRKISFLPVNDASLFRIVKFFNEMNTAQQKVNEFYHDLLNYPACASNYDREQISSCKDGAIVHKKNLRKELGKILVKVRAGNCHPMELDNLVTNYYMARHSPPWIEERLKNWRGIAEKVNLAKEVENFGGKYIGFGGDLEEELIRSFDKKTYIFYFKMEDKANLKIWSQNKDLFLMELKRKNEVSAFFAVDCEFHPDLASRSNGNSIKVTKRGVKITDDLLSDLEKVKSIPLAMPLTGSVKTLKKSANRVPFTLPCPGPSCDMEDFDWHCYRCLEELEWGFDGFVYCSCGKSSVDFVEFKCPDKKHGFIFRKHEPTQFKNLLARIKVIDEVNILLLGDIGTGKSTFINAISNLIRFKNLEAAVSHKNLISSVPICFTVKNSVIRTGFDPNEVFVPGQSTTENCKIHEFQMARTTIRLIDAPGIGDSRGITQDKLNLKNILKTVEGLYELHGICVLIKQDKPSIALRYCLKELLTVFHRDAIKNIAFCFTNSNGTFHKPEDIPLVTENLQVQRSLQNVFSFENDFFRFLAAVKTSSVKFPEEEITIFSQNWNKSQNEMNRLINLFCKLSPHPVKSTLGLNLAREMVLKFNKIQTKTSAFIFIHEKNRLRWQGRSNLRKKFNKEEVKIVRDGVEKLALFLKKNAIFYFNEETESYLNYLLDLERSKINGGKESKIITLDEELISHLENKRILEREIAQVNTQAEVTVNQVIGIADNLNKLINSHIQVNHKKTCSKAKKINKLEELTDFFPSAPPSKSQKKLFKRCF